MADYSYQLEAFEGPLDLLLHLIEKHKIDIYDIPIAKITEQYMAHLDNWAHFDIHYSSEFLVMAATLLQIKSRLLLPVKAKQIDEEEDPRDELVERLVEYKQIKSFKAWLEARAEASAQSFSRPEEVSQWGIDRVYPIEMKALYAVFQEVYHRLPPQKEAKVTVVEVEREHFSVEDKLILLKAWLKGKKSFTLRSFLYSAKNREELVVSFMAILEMLKRQEMVIRDEAEDIFFEEVIHES